MHEVRLENFRCFREQQTARLAPLTLLVGENSTGKTSFLAMVRALNAIFAGKWEYNFKDAPYDLGSFDEIAHHRGGRGGRATEFTAGFSSNQTLRVGKSNRVAFPYKMDLGFVRQGSVPILRYRRWQSKTAWIYEHFDEGKVDFGEGSSAWTWRPPDLGFEDADKDREPPPLSLWGWPSFLRDIRSGEDISPQGEGTRTPTPEQFARFERLARVVRRGGRTPLAHRGPLFAAAPVRSKPHRTYNPSPYSFDAEGSYVPMYLADIFFRQRKV